MLPTDLKTLYKSSDASVGSTDLKALYKSSDASGYVPTGHVQEVFRLLTDVTEGEHKGMQNYVVNQTLGDR